MKPEAITELKKQLDPSHIKQRDGAAGMKLDYLAGWFVISEANRIFGFDGWSSETLRLEHVGTVDMPPDKYGKIKKHVAYRSTVQVTIDGIVRQGSGYGDGIEANELKAHELAIKESETDARKRAFMTFGNPFGLALYDKERNGVAEAEKPAPKTAPEKTTLKQTVLDSLKLVDSEAALGAWYAGNEPTIKRLSESDKDEIRRTYANKLEQLEAA